MAVSAIMRRIRNISRPRPADAVSGLVTALFSIPEGMAYASIGGFNPVSGLYSGMLSTLVGSMFARTALMVTTLTSAIALSSQSVLSSAGLDPHDVGNIAMLTVAVGAVMLVMGLLRVGAIMDFVSSAVMTGFTVGIAVQIVAGVLGDVTGYDPERHNTVVKFVEVLGHVPQWSGASVAVALGTVAVWGVLQFVRPVKSYATLIALVAVTAVAAVTGADTETVGDIAKVPNSLPPFTFPDLSAFPNLVLGAFAIALVGLAQAAGISAAVPNPDGSKASASGDFSAQGAANIVGGFFGSLPTGGSLSRTGVAVSAGATSRWAGVFAGAWLVVLVLIAGAAAQIIPMPVIGGLLFVIGFELIQGRWADVTLVLRTAPLSAVAMVATFLATTQIPLQYAILVGAGISLVLYCVQAARSARLLALVRDDEGWRLEEPPKTLPANGITVLYYAGVALFAEVPRISETWPAPPSAPGRFVVILNVRVLPDVPSATLQKLLRAKAEALRKSGGRLMLAGVSPAMIDAVTRAGLVRALGEENVVPASRHVFGGLDTAYADAQRWLVETDGNGPDAGTS
ncbi:SulP family inorganic anion transporter [Gordonia sihwensis]|uniref:Putative transporter n=1 Tax=Gordonia sihwensis NBRC 108236 TaxID=1223544 RepID=L7LGR2_9ACTN|nr:SulP family inorganic anion transporter [Gordonia sihwensis]WFN93390.1 SulP family inorganic anion transporter [Gordonia sihwensis]GAC59253.1 putative transporter [Gordonia sihwensis NBRC 108236]